MTRYDLVIKNGLIVTSTDQIRADIGINGEKIVALAHHLRGDEEVDATGLIVMPGGVDGHCHIEQDEADGTVHEDGFASATGSALLGGTTTVVCFSAHLPGRELKEQFLAYREKGQASRCDYAIHQIVTRTDKETLETGIPEVVALGAAGLKVFMTYDAFHLADDQVLQVLSAALPHDMIVSLHCENYEAIRFLVSRHLAEGKIHAHSHATSRPVSVEREATSRAIALSEVTGQPIQIFHVSSPEVAAEIARARDRGVQVTAETCTHYLTLTEDELKREGFEGAKFICSPPLRSVAEREGMWRALLDGTISVVSSDHCGYTFEGSSGKARYGRDADFSKIPNGMPGLGTRLPVLFDAAITGNRIDLTDFVRVTATNPAKRYGLYPRKGTIAPGSDADLVLWDPELRKTISPDLFESAIDYTPYDGREVTGWPVATYLRGRLTMKDGALRSSRGDGQYLARAGRSHA